VVALGRKNYLFAGSNAGGGRAAAIDPEIYLHHVIDRSADHPIGRIKDLLPWNVSLTPHS
jgi:transposase